MYNQRKEDKSHRIAAFGGEAGACVGVENFQGMTVYNELYAQFGGGLARVSTGYEAGLFGAEGRGVYVGGTVAGIHGELTHIEKGPGGAQGSWGLQESMYLSFGNNTGIAAADGKTTSMVSAEIWFPTLGSFGHSAFGDQYDVSSLGIRKTQLEKIRSILKNSSNPEDIAVVGILDKLLNDDNEIIKTREFLRIGRALRRNGFELVDRPGDHSDGTTKFTFRKANSWEYGNIEFMSSVKQDKAYCSYNYGNNFLTHFFIDYLGFKGRGD